MAIWQYNFLLIYKNSIELNNLNLSNKISNSLYESKKWWEGFDLSNDIEHHISEILKPNKSWSENIQLWGKESETCIEILKDFGLIQTFRIRLDLRTLTKKLFYDILYFIKKINCLIINDEGKIFLPDNINDIINDIKTSHSFKFISNSENFLQNLEKQ